MTRTAHRRGFTILETVMVLVIVALVSAATFAWYGNASSPDKDTTAKTSLLAFTEMQQQTFLSSGIPADVTQMAELDFTRSWTAGASEGPQEVSVALDGSVAMAAASSGAGVCWFVRMDVDPTPTSPPVLWYAESTSVDGDCLASRIVDFAVPDTSESDIGTIPGKPVLL